jgi:hypothetical protein
LQNGSGRKLPKFRKRSQQHQRFVKGADSTFFSFIGLIRGSSDLAPLFKAEKTEM